MKKAIFISILLAFTAMAFTSSNSDELIINTGNFGGTGGSWFSINGELSDNYLAVILAKFPDAERERKMFKWKLKDLLIPGIDNPVTFQIHQGVHYVKDENGYSGFHTFENKTVEILKCNEEKSDKMEKGITIYVYKNKIGRRQAIKTEREEKLVKEYLYSIFEK